jgi:FemAB family protein
MQNGVLSPVALYMLERGAACATQFSCDINLQVQVEDIWRNIRKSFKPLINKSKKLLSHTLVTAQTITPDCIEEFKALHLAAAGRRTRNDLSWDIQLQQIRNNDAFIIMSYFGTELVGASFYLMPFRRCDYGVGAYKRELFKEMPIAHGAMWEAILYAKSSNCHYFDVGPYYFSFQLNTVSEKEMSIGIFRKGFTEYISPTFLLNLN